MFVGKHWTINRVDSNENQKKKYDYRINKPSEQKQQTTYFYINIRQKQQQKVTMNVLAVRFTTGTI